MPVITIQVTREGTTPEAHGVTAEQKAQLIKGASELLLTVLGKPVESTFVIIDEVELENWGWGGLPSWSTDDVYASRQLTDRHHAPPGSTQQECKDMHMGSPLAELNLSNPVIAAPMAGGASTPELVIAAARAGSLGLLAGGMRPPELLAGDIGKVCSETDTFGVNLFAPNPMPVDLNRFHDYASHIQTEADVYGVDLSTAEPVEDDDEFHDKVDLLVSSPVPVVSFTFGVPDALTIQRLRRAGTVVVQTVTSAHEARHAEQAGADVLVVQSTSAGGHSGTLTPKHLPAVVPLTELIATIRHVCRLPLIAAGGLSTCQEVAAVLANGAEAAMVGTLLLRTNESGTSATHKAALGDPDRTETVVTRAFTGRPARALRNRFTDRFSAIAPLGYPALHHLSTPLRKAATAAGDLELMNLWAGTGFRNAVAEGAGQTLTRLAASL